MELVWAEHLSVGNATIDAEHQNLIAVVNNMVHAAGAGDCGAFAEALALFETCIHLHFRHEEIIADAVNLHLPRNKKEHLKFLHEMQQMINNKNIENGIRSVELIKKYSSFLNMWIADHIQMDMQMKPILQASPCELEPIEAKAVVFRHATR